MLIVFSDIFHITVYTYIILYSLTLTFIFNIFGHLSYKHGKKLNITMIRYIIIKKKLISIYLVSRWPSKYKLKFNIESSFNLF